MEIFGGASRLNFVGFSSQDVKCYSVGVENEACKVNVNSPRYQCDIVKCYIMNWVSPITMSFLIKGWLDVLL